MTERRRAEPVRATRPRTARRARRARSRAAPASSSSDGATSAICSGGVPARISSSSSSPTSSSVPRAPAPSKKRTAPSSVDRRRRRFLEQRALEVRERRVRVLGRPRRELLDRPVGERRQIGRRARERGEGEPARLVGQRDEHLGAAGERLEERPLGAGQVLEAVREDRLAVPGARGRSGAARPRAGARCRGPRARAGRARRGRRA